MATNILALSYLFPNRAQPAYGIFVFNRLRAVRAFCNVKVIAPVQWYPLIRLIRRNVWGGAVPARECIGDMDVFHPRFAVIPKFLKWIDAITYFLSVRAVIRRLAQDEAFDFSIIDVHWTYPDVVAAYLIASRRKKKFIVTVRGHEALYLEENTIRRRLVARYLRKADAVIALSAELRDKVIALGVSPERAHVVLNGVDQTQFKPLNRDACRAQLGLPLDKKIVISVGRLAAGKGHQDLIRAMAELRSLRAELYIIGGVNPEDDFERALRDLITDLKLDNVHLVDKVEHAMLPLWYGAADVFSLATKREGCPNVVLESLACGTPVVVNDVGAVAELVTSGRNGYLVPAPDELATLLARAFEKNWDRSAVAASMDDRGWAHCAAQLQRIYQTVLQAPARHD
jgi:teichuronic acid biosynthesis glycosyltransferase TuaC